MTWIGGDSCQNDTGWSHILKESGIASYIDVYARSGATWTNTKSTRCNPNHYTELLHDDNVIYNQAIRLIENTSNDNAAPDIIILFAGANDAWFVDKRPGIFDNSIAIADNPTIRQHDNLTNKRPNLPTSLEGSVNHVCEILQKSFPNASLIFVTPLQMSKTDAETIFKVSDIIERVASEKGCHTLRADKETGIIHEEESAKPKYTYDGVHTNTKGARILGEYILKFLLSHINNETYKLTIDN